MKKIKDVLNKITIETVKYTIYRESNALKAGEYNKEDKTIPVYKRHFTKVRVPSVTTINGNVYENIDVVIGGETEHGCDREISWTMRIKVVDEENYSGRVLNKVYDYLRDLENEVEILEEDVKITSDIFEDVNKAIYANVSTKFMK